uniref:Uncharacterized protein n=1 Tax=Ditylum brightwellii TaxID=49249 RepID=A0A7S4R9Z3_9STRA
MTLKINSPARKTTQTSPTPGKEETATQEEAKGHLPFEARRLAGLATAGNQLSTEEGILAWTSLDPYYANNRKALRLRVLSTKCCFVLVVFLPFIILFSPNIVWAMKKEIRTMKGQYWILTKRDLRIVNTEQDWMCKTIPLEQITSIQVVKGEIRIKTLESSRLGFGLGDGIEFLPQRGYALENANDSYILYRMDVKC